MNLRRTLAVVVTGLSLLAGTCTSAVAAAPTNSRPVTVADRVTLKAGTGTDVEPLANDSDPDGDELAMCRLGDLPAGINAYFEDDELWIEAEQAGTYTIDYYACDFEYLTKGTITVVVTPPTPFHLTVRKAKRPGMLRVVNHNDYRLSFAWGSVHEGKADGSRWIRPGKKVLVSVRRPSIVWVAVNQRENVFEMGVVRRIRLPHGVHALPAGAPGGGDHDSSSSSRTVPSWR